VETFQFNEIDVLNKAEGENFWGRRFMTWIRGKGTGQFANPDNEEGRASANQRSIDCIVKRSSVTRMANKEDILGNTIQAGNLGLRVPGPTTSRTDQTASTVVSP